MRMEAPPGVFPQPPPCRLGKGESAQLARRKRLGGHFFGRSDEGMRLRWTGKEGLVEEGGTMTASSRRIMSLEYASFQFTLQYWDRARPNAGATKNGYC